MTFDGSKGRQRTGKENLDLDACSQKVGQLGERDKVAEMGCSGGPNPGQCHDSTGAPVPTYSLSKAKRRTHACPSVLSPSRRRDLAPRGSPSSARRRALRPSSASRAGTFPPASYFHPSVHSSRSAGRGTARGNDARREKSKRVSGRQQPCRQHEGPGRTAWLP